MLTLMDIFRRMTIDSLLTQSNWNMHLFQNDVDPSDPETVLADLTECDFSGYAAVGLTYPASVFNPATGKATCTPNTPVFAHDGGATANDVYGYFITWDVPSVGLRLMAAERFPLAPRTFANVGDVVTIVHTIGDDQ